MKTFPIIYSVVSGCICVLVFFAPVSLAESYKCEKEGVIVYSDTRCGPIAERSDAVQNTYSGSIRPGEQQMLNESAKRESSAASSTDNSESYADRIRQENEARKARGNERRIERDSSSPWR